MTEKLTEFHITSKLNDDISLEPAYSLCMEWKTDKPHHNVSNLISSFNIHSVIKLMLKVEDFE